MSSGKWASAVAHVHWRLAGASPAGRPGALGLGRRPFLRVPSGRAGGRASLGSLLRRGVVIVSGFTIAAFGARSYLDALAQKTKRGGKARADASTVRVKIVLPEDAKETAGQQAVREAVSAGVIRREELAELTRQRAQKFAELRRRLEAPEFLGSDAISLDDKLSALFSTHLRPRIAAFADWYFKYSTTYVLLHEAAKSAARHSAGKLNPARRIADDAKVSELVQQDLAEFIEGKYQTIVLRPTIVNFQLQALFKTCLASMEAGLSLSLSLSLSLARSLSLPYSLAPPLPLISLSLSSYMHTNHIDTMYIISI